MCYAFDWDPLVLSTREGKINTQVRELIVTFIERSKVYPVPTQTLGRAWNIARRDQSHIPTITPFTAFAS